MRDGEREEGERESSKGGEGTVQVGRRMEWESKDIHDGKS
jgi:hypothetical protein